MRIRLEVTAVFIAVGFGALTVTLLYDARALIPHPPYRDWIIGRVFALGGLACLGMLLLFGLEDEFEEMAEADGPRDRPIHWFVIGLAFLISALASATFIGASALVDYLDRVSK